jgi:serine/threonine protein kinase
MGVVYEARDPKLGRLLAVKLLPEGALAGETARARFLREAQNASSLNHPNIATIYEVGEDAGETCIAMELVEGRPLSAAMDREGLAPETALRYALEISAGLAHARERGIVHRDQKPANVVVSADGHIKILDFGLAKTVRYSRKCWRVLRRSVAARPMSSAPRFFATCRCLCRRACRRACSP